MDAALLVQRLIGEGLAERGPGDHHTFQLTIKGNALANASFARPIRRTTTDQLVGELLDRVRHVNDASDLAFRVRRLRVFGSYLRGDDALGDVDIAIDLGPEVGRCGDPGAP